MKPTNQQPTKPVPDRPSTERPSAADQVLDHLLDALEQRLAARQAKEAAISERLDMQSPIPEEMVTPASPPVPDRPVDPLPSAIAAPGRRPEEEDWSPPPSLPSVGLGRMLGRLLLALAALVVLVNIPVNRHGTPLARIMPDSAALVIRDGLVLKASGPDIYVLQDDKLRWISSLEAFEYFGYSWPQVRVVDESFLQKFEVGRPLHVLLKCDGSPHIYALENQQKRWIKDIETFETEGYVWEDVMSVDCTYLRSLPDGLSIPEDAGPPPKP
jgi:hypothetical protein